MNDTPLRLDADDYALFGLPRRFELDRAALDQRWRRLQAQVHPDRYVADGAGAQRVAMQWSVRVNEAYRRLREPLARAAYLCELNGAPIDAQNNTRMPAEFLMQQMAWREALDEANDLVAVHRLDDAVQQAQRSLMAEVQSLLDERHDAAAAAERVRALMFVERFRSDIDHRIASLDP